VDTRRRPLRAGDLTRVRTRSIAPVTGPPPRMGADRLARRRRPCHPSAASALWERAGLVSVSPLESPDRGLGAAVGTCGGLASVGLRPAGGAAASRRTLVHSCGQLCG
jgi:hypothetical protein